MTDKLHYNMTVEIERGSDIEQIEEKLELVLEDLYDVDTVEAIRVRDKTPPMDEDIEKLLDVFNNLESEDIRCAIETVKRLEDTNDE